MAKKVKATRPRCKVSACPRHKSAEGFCDICYGRFKKGFYDVNGNKTLNTIHKERRLEAKRKRRSAKAEHKQWLEKKASIAEKVTLPKLKVLQDKHQETRKSWHCIPLEFQTCDAVCFARIFLWSERHPECNKCHANDAKFDFFENFLEGES